MATLKNEWKKGDYWKINLHDFEGTNYCTQCKKLSIQSIDAIQMWAIKFDKKMKSCHKLNIRLQGHTVAHNVKSNL